LIFSLQSYLYIYLVVVVILGFTPIYKIDNNKNKALLYKFIIFILFVLATVLFLSRDINASSDISHYYRMYEKALTFEDIFLSYHGNVFFTFILYIGNLFELDKELFFLTLPIFYLLIYYVGIKQITKNIKLQILMLSFFMLSSTYILLFTNVIRQGLAMSLFILAIGLYINNKKILVYFMMVFSLFSHFSMIPMILVFYIAQMLMKKGITSKIFFISIISAVSGFAIIEYLPVIGGIFYKIERFADQEYESNIIYVKIALLFCFLILFYYYGKRLNLFDQRSFKYVFLVYMLGVNLILFSMPIIKMASRFIYYPSALLPILFAFTFLPKNNLLPVKQRFLFYFIFTVIYSLFVFNFQSITKQLGV